MTIGSKFLDRVLTEDKKDVDGFKDNFDIASLPATHPAVANMPMPMARQVVQLYHLMGVSTETLEMRPKAVREAAIGVAEQMRTNRPLRMAAQRLFTTLATAKGFARKEEEVMEASASMTPEKDMQLLGNTVVKQMEAVLAAMKLPSGVLQRAMRRDQATMMETAEILRSGAGRSKFAMLASELGVDLASVGQTVKVQEASHSHTPSFTPDEQKVVDMVEKKCGKGITRCSRDEVRKALVSIGATNSDHTMMVVDVATKMGAHFGNSKVQEDAAMDGPQLGTNRSAQAMETLIGALGLQNVFNSREAMAVRRALPERMANLRNPTAVYTLIDRLVKELANTK